MRFELTKEEVKKLREWAAEQDKVIIERNKRSKDRFARQLALDNMPYYGAIGGELTYEFTPTSIGVVVKVTHAGTKEVLDLTDYENW